MKTHPFILQIREKLPEADWSWVVSALRQDSLVWESLQDPDFSEKALTTIGKIAQAWAPAHLGLMALEINQTPDTFQLIPLSPLQSELETQALTILQEVAQGQTPFENSAKLKLAHATLLALGMRERLRASGSWKMIIHEFQPISENWSIGFSTMMACLFRLVPEPLELLRELIRPDAGEIMIRAGLHMLLSNPLSIQDQLSCLLQAAPSEFTSALPMLRILAQVQPHIAQLLAETIIHCGHEKPPLKNHATEEYSWDARLDSLRQQVYLAELQLLSNNPQKSAGLIKEIQADTAVLLDNLNSIWEVASYGRSDLLPIPELILPTIDHPNQDANPDQIGKEIQNFIQAVRQNDPSSTATIAPLRARALQMWTENLLQAADSLYKRGYYPKVIELANLLLTHFPSHPHALNLLGKSLTKVGNFDASVQVLGIAATLVPEQLDLHRNLAQSLEANRDWQQALLERRAIVTKDNNVDPSSMKTDLYSLANCAVKAGDIDFAIQICNQILAEEPDDGAAHAILGHALYEANRSEEGLEHLDQATQLAPHLAASWLAIAKIQLKKDGFQPAIHTLRTAILSAPGNPELHLALAEALEAASSPTEAETALLQAYQLIHQTPDADYILDADVDIRLSLALGRLHRKLGRKDQAFEVLEKAYTYYVACGKIMHAEIAYSYAQALLDIDQAKKALPILENLIQDNPDTISTYVDYAKALLSVGGKPDAAAAALHIALEKEPECKEALALLADAYFMAKDYNNAITAYQSALDTDLASSNEGLARLSYGLGRSALALGKSEIAIAALQEAVNSRPDIADYHQSLAEAYWEAGLYTNAYQTAQTTLQMDGNNIDLLSWFTLLSTKLYENLTNLAPSQDKESENSNDMIVGLKPKQILHEALNTLTLATSLAPDRGDLLLQLSRLEILAGENTNAGQVLHQLLALPQISSPILAESAELFSIIGDKQGAVASLERAVEQESDYQDRTPLLMLKLANAHVENGAPASALKILAKTVILFPNDVSVYQYYTQLLVELDQAEQAIDMLMNGLHATQNDTTRAAILYLAAPLQYGTGNLAASLCSVSHLVKTIRHSTLPVSLNLKYRNLAADLLFSAIQDEQAQSCLEDFDIASARDASDDNTWISAWSNFHCLKAEIALEAGEEINTAGNLNQTLQSTPHSIRSLALQTRLLSRSGDKDHARSVYQEALDRLPITYNLKNDLYINIKDLIALSQAAFELEDWDLACELAQKAVTLAPHDIQGHLTLTRLLVQEAEYQRLCQEIHAHQHGPGSSALQDHNQATYSKEIETVQNLVKILVKEYENKPYTDQNWEGFHVTSQPAGLSRWQIRGQVVFEESLLEPSEFSIQVINAPEWSGFNWTAEDHAARLSIIRRFRLDDQIAQRETQDALKSYPKDLRVLLWIIQIFSTLDPEASLTTSYLAANLLSPKPGSISALVYAQQASVLHQQGNLEAALKAIDAALTIWQDEPDWHFLAAKILKDMPEAQDNIQKAVSHLENAIQLLEHEPSYHLELGQLYLSKNHLTPTKLDQAIHALQTAVQLSPANPQAWYWLAQAYVRYDTRSSLLEALDCSERVMKIIESDTNYQNEYEPYLLRADIALKLGNAEEALTYTNKAVQINPGASNAVLLQVKTLEILDQPNQALAAVEQALPLMEEPLVIRLKHIELVEECQGLPVALRMIQDLAETYPSEPEVLYLMAQLLVKAGNFDAAVEAAQLCLQLNSTNHSTTSLSIVELAATHHLIGRVFHETGQLDSAIHHFNEAIRVLPSMVESYLELGKVYQKQRQLRKANTTYEQATQAAPQDFRAYYAAGMSLKDGKDYMGAQAMLKRASELAPGEVQIRKQLAAVAALALVHNPQSSRIPT
jgi:tetratricopeptide (TPR) repeat protein